jgi:hypothetical protein
MASKQMKFDTDARAEIAAGLSQLARAVKATLGPRGRNVILQKSFGSPRITKDGVTVSKEIELPQPFENMGAKLVNMVASKTGDVAGDGTRPHRAAEASRRRFEIREPGGSGADSRDILKAVAADAITRSPSRSDG